MTPFILSGMLIGGLIGARLTVLALLPAAACTVAVAAMVPILRVGGLGWTALDLMALLGFLQIGYLCGAGVRIFVRPPRMISEQERLRSS
jgi:hypothetical protein